MYLVSYDIASNKVRRKIAKVLSGYGRRIQYSVFECKIDVKRYKALYRELVMQAANMKDGNIRIYTISDDLYNKTVTIGDPSYISEESQEEVWLI